MEWKIKEGMPISINDQVAHPDLWQTPTACEWKGRGPNSKQQGLAEEVRLYPTPVASDATVGGVVSEDDTYALTSSGTYRKINRNGTNGSIGLGRLVKLYPTVTSREYKGARSAKGLKKAGRTPSNSLSDTISAEGSVGQLNPDWVEWLMGFPIGWTNIDCENPMELKSEGDWWANEPENIPRVASGVNNRINRIKTLGNAVVPAQGEAIFWAIRKVIEAGR